MCVNVCPDLPVIVVFNKSDKIGYSELQVLDDRRPAIFQCIGCFCLLMVHYVLQTLINSVKFMEQPSNLKMVVPAAAAPFSPIAPIMCR